MNSNDETDTIGAGVHDADHALDVMSGADNDRVGQWLTRSRQAGVSRCGGRAPSVEELAFGETSVSVSSDGCTRTVRIPEWWTREGQPETWVTGPIGPGGEYDAVRIWPPQLPPSGGQGYSTTTKGQ